MSSTESAPAHQPVLLDEVLTHLVTKPEGVYVDGTFGRGGHARAILSALDAQGRLIAFDQDPEAVKVAQQSPFKEDTRFSIQHASFAQLKSSIDAMGCLGKVDGIFLDLGVSSPQLDRPERGFSFLREGPLDMRMDTTRGIDAATWLNEASESEIAKVLRRYGEERFARRIAVAIVRERATQRITTTRQLANLVEATMPFKHGERKHPATRTFQGIRIFINDELEALKSVLAQSLEVLATGGRLVVISFHSLEDRMVKHFIRQHEHDPRYPEGVPVRAAELQPPAKRVGRAIRPTEAEVARNPRARSAVMRVMERLK